MELAEVPASYWQEDGHAAGSGDWETGTWLELLSAIQTRHQPSLEFSEKSRIDIT